MDPLSYVASAPLDLRLAQALRSELSSVLRAGRVLPIEVLEASADGTALLAVAGRRVPAESKIDLRPGERFLAVVEDANGALGLRRVSAVAPGDELLLDALRAVVAEEMPAGARVAQLLVRIASAEVAGQDRTSLASEPTAPEPSASRQPAPAEIVAGDVTPGAPHADDTAAIAELTIALRAHIVPLDGGARDGGAAHGDGAAVDGRSLRTLLESSGLFFESRLLRAARRGPGAAMRGASSARDLKASLLTALGTLGPGPRRAAVEQALAGLEAEQLLNVARARSGDAPVVGLPVPDPSGTAGLASLASAHVLFVREDPAQREDETESDADRPSGTRIALGIELSRLGPVRADVRFDGTRITVRFSVERAGVAERIRADVEPLSEELAIDGRAARVEVATTSRAEASVGAEARNVRFLRDHHLVDLLG